MLQAVSQLCILSASGEVYVRKFHRSDLPQDAIDIFISKMQAEQSALSPYMVEGGVHFYSIRRHGLYLVAASRVETSQMFVIELLSRLYQQLKDFCGVLNEESISLNLVLVNEVMYELLDNGYVQLTSTDKLKPYIQSEPVPCRPEPLQPGLFGLEQRVAPGNASNKPAVRPSWDQEARRNEIFVDVIEKVSAVFAANGNIMRCELSGHVNMKSFLGGSPQIKLGLNEDLYLTNKCEKKAYGNQTLLNSCSFHECVNLKEFEASRTLHITPPAGEVSVIKYQIEDRPPHPLPLRLQWYVREKARDMEVGLRLVSETPVTAEAVNVTVTVPVPKGTNSLSQQLSGPDQSAQLHQESKNISWTIKKLLGKSEASAVFKLIPLSGNSLNTAEVGPVAVDFEISGYVCSGLQIKFLRVFEKEHSYVPYRWIRYITVTDSYMFRLQ